MKKNIALEKIRRGEPAFAFSLGMGSAIAAEIAANAGFDWIWIDRQHGAWDDVALLAALQVAHPTPTAAIVRPGANDFFRIGRVLDAGAQGVVVPMVNTVDDACAAVNACKYPPEGGRSSGGARMSLFGDDYFERANDETLVAVQIETRQALANASAIAAVDGVDCLFVGPADLARSMGVEQFCPEHEKAIAQILAAATEAGKAGGIACRNIDEALRFVDLGFTFVTTYSDLGALLAGMNDVLNRLGRG